MEKYLVSVVGTTNEDEAQQEEINPFTATFSDYQEFDTLEEAKNFASKLDVILDDFLTNEGINVFKEDKQGRITPVTSIDPDLFYEQSTREPTDLEAIRHYKANNFMFNEVPNKYFTIKRTVNEVERTRYIDVDLTAEGEQVFEDLMAEMEED